MEDFDVAFNPYDPKDPAEKVWYSCDFSRYADTITSATSSISWVGGEADASPGDLKVGEPQVGGAIAAQLIEGGVNGADYELEFTATKDSEVFVERVIIRVRRKPPVNQLL